MVRSSLGLSVLMLALSFVAAGQAGTAPSTERVINGGVVNGKAKVLPEPGYPSAAAEVGVGGQVSVTVLIDETGRVISAEANGGVENAALREAAREAALRAEFSPTTLEGRPVKVKGTINYNFVLEKDTSKDKLKYMSFATMLTAAKSFENDLEKFAAIFKSKDLLGEMAADFPEFAAELKPFGNLADVAPNKRKGVIDEVISVAESKVGASEKWQLAAGREFGGLMGPMMFLVASGEKAEALVRYDSAVKGHLSRLSKLTADPPADIPKEFIEKLAFLGALHDREQLFSKDNVPELVKRTLATADALSPPPQ